MTSRKISRRCGLAGLLGLALRLFLRPGRAAAMPASFGRALEPLPSAREARHRRERRAYRADAVILLFSVPIFRRAGVGGGLAVLEEFHDAAGRFLSLHFSGGSLPQRAHGLNRLGWFRELVQERDGTPEEAHYFGVLSASKEESLNQGRAALAAGQDLPPCTAIDGHNARDLSRSAVTRFPLPPGCTWSDRRLVEHARASFEGGLTAWKETLWSGGATPWTFLYALSRLLTTGAARSECRYVYHERRFRLSIETQPDPRQARLFAERGLGVRPEAVLKVRGKAIDEHTAAATPFQLWIERSDTPALPLRIELQPRSFLRLSFEAQPDGGVESSTSAL